MSNPVHVEIWSDIRCPFCYIGKRHFESALSQFDQNEKVQVTWKSFQLDPTLVTDPGINSVQHLAKIKGWDMEQARQATTYVTEMAKKAGLDLNPEAAVVANSMDAHRIIQLAKEKNKAGEAEEALFRAHFTEGKNIGDHAVLMQIAEAVGLDKQEASDMLASGGFSDAVERDQEEARQLGVRGVPFFVFNRQYAVSGAQPPDVFLQNLKKAAGLNA